MSTFRYLSRTEASEYLNSRHGIKRTPKTLAKLASTGRGPAFHKAGNAVLYNPADLSAWAIALIGAGAFSALEHRLASEVLAA